MPDNSHTIIEVGTRREKLEYMHRDPVGRGLVNDPVDWIRGSDAAYSQRGAPRIGIDFVSWSVELTR